ncbi:MAG: hypothetical protein MJE77_18965 [Proteobacteria bacterium]|nr:hypothetical protein [Pseudomonadota bacterium]
MTLFELMVVVSIIAILATIAVPLFMKTTRRAKAAEVPAMFAEFKLRQQQYYTENGSFLSTGGYPGAPDENDAYPAVPSGPDMATPITLPDSWKALRMQPDKQSLYCSYVTIAGAPSDNPAGFARAGSFGMTASETDWFFLIAECDFDGVVANRDTDNSWYFTNSDTDRIAIQNEGR